MAETIPQTELQKIEDWRRDEFVRLGVPFDQAVSLAVSKLDLGEFRNLIDSGCDVQLAIKILA